MQSTPPVAHLALAPHPGRSSRALAWGIVLSSLLLVVAVALLPPLPEPEVFRRLADERNLFGIPNFLNVASNLPLLVIGAWGLDFVARGRESSHAFAVPTERWPYALCFLGVALSAVGSTYYHLAPDGATLFWDRLPMALGFMALLSAVIVERIDAKAGLRLLVPFLVAGAASVVYWRWSMLHATENLLPYAIVQYGTIAAILVMALRFPSRYTRGSDIFGVMAIYGAAKVAEVLDAQAYALGQVVSGHTLKHLVAALAVYWLLRMLRLRRPA
jgi:hypothetical protein